MDLFISLINNATLLISLAMLQSFIVQGIAPESRLRDLSSGLLFGATAVLVMTLSVPALAGMEFNARSVVLSVAGLFGGPIAAGVATLMAVAYRVYLGHPGVGMGIPVIVTAAGLGVVGHGLRRSGHLTLDWKSLFLFGILVHLGVLAWLQLLPEDVRWPVLESIAGPILLVFPLATVLLGHLLLLVESSDQTLRRLRETQSRLMAAEANAHIGHWWLDPKTQQGYWADEIYRILGIEPSLPAGPATLRQCAHPGDWDRLQASLMFALEGGSQHRQQYRIVRPDGEVRWVDCRGMALRGQDGEVQRVVGTFQDVTERVLAEQSAQTAEQRLIKAQAVGQVGDWEYNLASGAIRASDEAFRIYGMAAPASGEMPIATMEACIVERERVHQALVDLIESDQPYDLEFAIRPENRSAEIIIASKAELVRDEDGRPIKVLGAIQDITHRKSQENRVEAQRSFLAAILESTGDAIIACDREGRQPMIFIWPTE